MVENLGLLGGNLSQCLVGDISASPEHGNVGGDTMVSLETPFQGQVSRVLTHTRFYRLKAAHEYLPCGNAGEREMFVREVKLRELGDSRLPLARRR